MSDDILLPGHARWLPLLLEGDPVDALVEEQVADLIGEVSDGDRREQVTAVVAGVTRRAREVAGAAEADGVMTLAAWMHLREPGMLEAGPVAFLRAFVVEGAVRLERVVELVVGDGERYGSVEVADHDTASGPAAAVRVRPVVDSVDGDGGRAVHEQRLVVWHRPRLDAAVVLSAYVTDLVLGAELGTPLLELAAGIDLGPA